MRSALGSTAGPAWGAVFGFFSPARDAHRKSKHRLDVLAIEVLEASHVNTDQGTVLEDFTICGVSSTVNDRFCYSFASRDLAAAEGRRIGRVE